MNARQAIRRGIVNANYVVQAYLADLSDAELLVRPTPDSNHIAWQLGHLAWSTNMHMNAVFPGRMPPLPPGFAERYTAQTAALDDPAAFLSKEEIVRIMAEQQAAALRLLDEISDDDLDRPSPEPLREYTETWADVFHLESLHPLMHAGQWAVIRRKLGRKPLF